MLLGLEFKGLVDLEAIQFYILLVFKFRYHFLSSLDLRHSNGIT
jgi:hypothetical protein